MIVKKPYAFLIKNFRLIHGLLFAALAYITYKSYTIYSFFDDYVTNHYYNNMSDLSSTYVNYLVFAIIAIAALISLLIYFILNLKKKESKTYLFIFIMMIILFIYNIYMYTIFSKLEIEALSTEITRVYRDISIIITIPQLIFTILMLSRTFGFNIKQFEFKKDLESMEIIASDNEEVELSFGDNTYKYKRLFRKLLRLTKYFIAENKLFVLCFSSIIVLILSLSIFVKINVYSKEYQQNQAVSAASLVFKVEDSYVTKYDIQHNVITNGKQYLIIKILIKNKYQTEYNLTRETFSLIVDKEKLTPIFSLKSEFKDMGNLFEPQSIKSNSENYYLIVFELDDKLNNKSYSFKIKNNTSTSIKDIESEFKNIKIKPYYIDNLQSKTTYNLPAKVEFEDSLLENMKLTISSYEIDSKFKDKTTILSNNSYKDIYYTIVPNNIGKSDKVVLKLKTNLEIEENNELYNIISNSSNLIDYYGIIKYKSYGKEKEVNANIVETKYNTNKYVYLEVPKDIKYAENIQLLLGIRGIKYTINLK